MNERSGSHVESPSPTATIPLAPSKPGPLVPHVGVRNSYHAQNAERCAIHTIARGFTFEQRGRARPWRRRPSKARGVGAAYIRPPTRVSTARQGRSGLGLEAQREAVRNHLNGGDWRVVAEFTEVESGKRKDRPKLAEALAACRVHNAKLIIAKLDRLARNVAFVSTLMEAGVEFEAVDFPQANRLTIHILAAVAEHEAKVITDWPALATYPHNG
jgi:hypothetical protein